MTSYWLSVSFPASGVDVRADPPDKFVSAGCLDGVQTLDSQARLRLQHRPGRQCVGLAHPGRLSTPRLPASRRRVPKAAFQDHNEEHLTDRHLLNYLFRRQNDGGPKRPTRLIFWDESSGLFPHAAALFGLPYKVKQNPFAPVEDGGDWGDMREASALIRAHTSVVQKYERCWMELTSQELNLLFHWGGTGHPTIVLVENIVEDLSLFWNLRMEGHEWIPRWIIPLPTTMPRDDIHAGLLKDWILAFLKFNQRPNHIFVTSQKAAPQHQADFAEWLKMRLEETPIKFVDVWPPANRLPNVTAFESEKLIEIRRQGRRATWLRPQSQVAEMFGSGVSWMVDLIEDARSRRSPFELTLPPGRTTTEILNAPSPPTVTLSIVARYGRGVDSINVRCTNQEELISHWLPTDKEILEELLHQYGLRSTEDEKRAGHLPAIKLLGGLEQPTRCCQVSGVSSFKNWPKVQRPSTRSRDGCNWAMARSPNSIGTTTSRSSTNT